jgi:hypothetical protein
MASWKHDRRIFIRFQLHAYACIWHAYACRQQQGWNYACLRCTRMVTSSRGCSDARLPLISGKQDIERKVCGISGSVKTRLHTRWTKRPIISSALTARHVLLLHIVWHTQHSAFWNRDPQDTDSWRGRARPFCNLSVLIKYPWTVWTWPWSRSRIIC